MIAALYVETDGCYYGLPDVDPWDKARDARQYAGPWPVVAHPPCQKWGKMAKVNFARWGGDHNRPEEDGGCFVAALTAVRQWGGVLEHPALSYAWDRHGLTRPRRGAGWVPADFMGGWTCEVWQSAYGHRAAKATWLYAHGVLLPQLNWATPAGTHQVGFYDQRGKAKNKLTLSKKEANGTPLNFRNVLLAIAKTARS